jgi:hypothetical protein
MNGKTTSRVKLSRDAYRDRRFDVALLMFPPHGHREFFVSGTPAETEVKYLTKITSFCASL